MTRSRHSTLTPEPLFSKIVQCVRCPRLVEYREKMKPRASYSSQVYWRKPVPGFGDIDGRLMIIGLGPASNGGQRTGRIFTGDASSRFLVKALHTAGFANQAVSESLEDGLVYTDCYLTAAVKCAPPGDKPTPEEVANCSPFLAEEIGLLRNLKAVLVLGALAFKAYRDYLSRRGANVRGLEFSHGEAYPMEGMPTLYISYHPSPRNTNTGKLSQAMLVEVLKEIRRKLASEDISGPRRRALGPVA
jgi:uracil-DNA glycosylase